MASKKVTRTDVSSMVKCLVADTKKNSLFEFTFKLPDDWTKAELSKVKRQIEKRANENGEIHVKFKDGEADVTVVRVISVTAKEELREMPIEDWFKYSVVVPGGRNGNKG